MSEWHPILEDYEEKREDNVSKLEHEKAWSKNKEFREKLKDISDTLYNYAKLLAEAAGVPSLI